MSNTKHVTDNLSEYLDGILTPGERARVDAHLAGCAACRDELAGLRYVVTMTRALPAVRAPRAFTLSPEMAARARPGWRFDWLYASLKGFTAIAAVLLFLVCSADFLAVNRSGGLGAAAPAPVVLSAPGNGPTASGVADQATNQSKSSPTVVPPAAPAGAAAAATSAIAPPAITAAPRQLPQSAESTASSTPRGAAALAVTPPGTARSAVAVPSATAVVPPNNTASPTPSPSIALTVTVTLYPTVPTPIIPPPANDLPEISRLRVAELGLTGALALCVVAMLFVRSARR